MRTCDLEGCEKPHRARGLCSTHYGQQNPNTHRKVEVSCSGCGSQFMDQIRHDRARRYCSRECRWRHEASERAVRKQVALFEGPAGRCEVPPSHPARRRDAPITGVSVVLVAGDCTRCGRATVVRIARALGTNFELTCSARCRDKQADDRRRARQRSAFVEPIYRKRVFERDNWVCQLCGDSVERDEVVPHPLAPTIDHVVPLAPYKGRAGGEHSMANAQTAHFLCNARKSYMV